MLPLSLLRTAQGHPILVELKNGETYNGQLFNIDGWMNMNLREVICTSRDGERFFRMPECYVRGTTVKYLRVPEEVLEKCAETIESVAEQAKQQQMSDKYQGRGDRGGKRGGRGGKGRGGGRGRGQ